MYLAGFEMENVKGFQNKYCRVYRMEVETSTPSNLLYPYFELCNYYAARHMCERLADFNEDGRVAPKYMIEGATAFIDAMTQWQRRDKFRSLNVGLID